MSNKQYSDVVCMVKNEIESIKKRDKELPPVAYVVMEIGVRLKNLQAWEGYNPKKSHTRNLRGIIEEILKGVTNTDRPIKQNPEMDVIWISPSPYENLEDSLGDRKAVGRSVDRTPTATKKAKLKKKLRQAS